jgi:hypothetical protein
VLSGEAKNTNFIVFGLTRSGFELEPTTYRTRGKHANHYINCVLMFTDEDDIEYQVMEKADITLCGQGS